jgi:hypothetical protein
LLTIIAQPRQRLPAGRALCLRRDLELRVQVLAVSCCASPSPSNREFKVPGNIHIGKTEIPVGLGLITLLLFATALVNLATKPLATVSGIGFSAFFFCLFMVNLRTHHHASAAEGRASIDRAEVYSPGGASPATIASARTLRTCDRKM